MWWPVQWRSPVGHHDRAGCGQQQQWRSRQTGTQGHAGAFAHVPQPRATEDHHTGKHVRAAQVPGHLLAPQVLQAQRFPGRRRSHVVKDGGQESTNTGMAGRAVHKPGKRGVRVHAGSRAGRRARGHGTGTPSRGAHVLVLGVLVHGQRDFISTETFPGRG